MSEKRASDGAQPQGGDRNELSDLDASHGAVTLEYVRVPTDRELQELLAANEACVANDTGGELELDEGDIEVVGEVEPKRALAAGDRQPTPPPLRRPPRSSGAS